MALLVPLIPLVLVALAKLALLAPLAATESGVVVVLVELILVALFRIPRAAFVLALTDDALETTEFLRLITAEELIEAVLVVPAGVRQSKRQNDQNETTHFRQNRSAVAKIDPKTNSK